MIGLDRLVGTCAAVFLLTVVVMISPADANGLVRYISTTGSNTNNCLLATPCRTIQKGINQTPSGGELRVLDSGNYTASGTINKSITITGDRPDVTISQVALTISNSNAIVALRNLQLAGGGTVQDAITITAASRVDIEDCVIQGYARYGVHVDGVAGQVSLAGATVRGMGDRGINVVNGSQTILSVTGSRFSSNGLYGILVAQGRVTISGSMVSANGVHGIYLSAVNGAISDTTTSANGDTGLYLLSTKLAVVRVSASNNAEAGLFIGSGEVAISHSVFNENNHDGISVNANGKAMIESSVLRGNLTRGLRVVTGGEARISDVTIVANSIGVSNNGTLLTRQNNTIEGNTGDVVGVLTPYLPK